MRVLVRTFMSALVSVLVALALLLTGALVAPSGAFALGTGSGSEESTGTTTESPGEAGTGVPDETETPVDETPAGESNPEEAPGGAAPQLAAGETEPIDPPPPVDPPPPIAPTRDQIKKWKLTSADQTYSGASFNNQYSRTSSVRRRNLNRITDAIDGTPGYEVPVMAGTDLPYTGEGFDRYGCPDDVSLAPGRIRISVYSIADKAFADALVRAHRRCVSVKLLMNNHLNEQTSRSFGIAAEGLGRNRGARSFGVRCSYGCRGVGVLHSKFFLFDGRGGTPDHTVVVGSSNMTSNAVNVQSNDLYGVNGQESLFDQFESVFDKMVKQEKASGPLTFSAAGGKYSGYFYPYRSATSSSDLTMRALRSISCTGATGGAGINGRSVIYINMHAWHGTRGKWLASRVRQMYNQGCYVRILYSFMGKGTYTTLKKGTGSRMVIRRVLFSNARQVVAVKYSHQKMFAASGNIAGDRSSWVVWTGSNNFSDRGIKADEVTLRVADRGAFAQYSSNWNFMRKQRSSSTWAIYEEPNGGGRAP